MEDDSEYLIQRSKMLQLRLDDAQKAIIAEKELVLKLIIKFY
jgi:hypothetical protein